MRCRSGRTARPHSHSPIYLFDARCVIQPLLSTIEALLDAKAGARFLLAFSKERYATSIFLDMLKQRWTVVDVADDVIERLEHTAKHASRLHGARNAGGAT